MNDDNHNASKAEYCGQWLIPARLWTTIKHPTYVSDRASGTAFLSKHLGQLAEHFSVAYGGNMGKDMVDDEVSLLVRPRLFDLFVVRLLGRCWLHSVLALDGYEGVMRGSNQDQWI